MYVCVVRVCVCVCGACEHEAWVLLGGCFFLAKPRGVMYGVNLISVFFKLYITHSLSMENQPPALTGTEESVVRGLRA